MKKYNAYNLKYLIGQLQDDGVRKEDFEYINFELSYDGCYYESDTPSIAAVFYDKNAKRNKKK